MISVRVTPDDRVSNVSFMDHLHEITFCVFHLRKYDFIFGPNRKMNSQNAFKYLFAESALVFFFFSPGFQIFILTYFSLKKKNYSGILRSRKLSFVLLQAHKIRRIYDIPGVFPLLPPLPSPFNSVFIIETLFLSIIIDTR